MRHYEIPEKYVTLIRNTYEGMTCKVTHAGKISAGFEVLTGVRQGCLLSPFLFLLAIDWITRKTTANKGNGIQWTLLTQLDELSYADDLVLLSHNLRQLQEKTSDLDNNSAQLGLNIHRRKTKILRLNTTWAEHPVTPRGESLENVESFSYLGSTIDKLGGTDADIKIRIQKERTTFAAMRNIWSSRNVTTRTKVRLFNSNIKPVLLYGSETWRSTKASTKKLQVFINKCLRRIFQLAWSDRVSNIELWQRCGKTSVEEAIRRRKWNWLGHTLRKPSCTITRQSLTWNPQGWRKRGPRGTSPWARVSTS